MSDVIEMETVKRYEVFIRKTDQHPIYQHERDVINPEIFYDFLIRRVGLDEKPQENFVVMAIDYSHRIKGYAIVAIGDYTNAVLSPSNIFQFAMSVGANAVILAHNHPSGSPEPSKNDISATEAFIEGGRILGIPVLDHLILTDSIYYSMAEECNEVIFNVEGDPNKNVVQG